MTCRSCGRALEPGTRFCPGCGTPVGAACAGCGAALPADARFCPSCGAPSEAGAKPRAAPEPARERKTATMLFADLVGSTTFAERHDPEIVSRFVGGVFERLAEEIRRYEGTIEKFAGDAMLAVFGVPVIHEDDPERAVRAALEMQTAIERAAEDLGPSELRPRLRIGISTGEVLVDLDRASGARDLFVTGDAVNTAARLQTAAEPGTVIVGPETYAATRDVVEYEALPPASLKGKTGLVAAWRAVAVKARRGGRRSPLGIEAPLVGRIDELAILKETVRRTTVTGRPQLVTVVGAAGVGKSRLVWELEKYLDGLPETYHWRKGRCLSYAQGSCAAIADVIKADIRATDDDPPTAVVDKLETRLVEISADGNPAIRTVLLATVGLGDAALARDQLVDGWARYLGLVAAIAPLVLVVEDIQWADDGVLDFIEYLARWGEGPIAIVCLARHELFDRRPAWGGGIANAATIVLEPLSASETDQLVDGLLAGGLPDAVRERVVGLADGNPLFAEELIRMFVDRGVLRPADGAWELVRPVEEIEVPRSVQAVLAARLDGLSGDEKRVAQTAAVIGRIFWDILLAHVSRLGPGPTGDLLRRLRVKELVIPRQPSSLAGATEFGFRHVLVRDVAYDSLPKRDRAALHVDVAGWAESALADRIDEFAELIAGHLAAALEYEVELSGSPTDQGLRELRELTYHAAVRAAHRAGSVSALPAAHRWQRLAIEQARILDLPPRERMELAADFYAYLWHEAEPQERVAHFTEAIELFERLPEPTEEDRQLRARLQAALAEALFETSDTAAAQAVLRAGIAHLEPGPPSRGRADLLRVLGWTMWRTGAASEAAGTLERAVADARSCGSEDALRWALHDLGLARSLTGQAGEGIDLLQESFEMARRAGDRALLGRCYINLPLIKAEHGDPAEEVMPLHEEGLQLARRDGAVATVAWIAANLAYEVGDQGRLDEGLALATESLEAAQRAGDDELIGAAREAIGWMHLVRGDQELARLEHEQSRSAGRRRESAGYSAMQAAAIEWANDPARAYGDLLTFFDSQSPEDQGFASVARLLARMAIRLGDRDGVVRADRAFGGATADRNGPIMVIRRRWIHGLAVDPDGSDVEAAAEELEHRGYVALAVDAYADAALIAARAGRQSEAEARALAICAETGVHHILGRLPETRWVVRTAAAPST
ncbi:MAG TPA: adenylate/guanylate cyclase domain-containing protein [Candidatus Limnocylindrales bacterium]|nr:adenylate/guanylate cyclase domain-containing protein [Candidatus Limnocylindrales bacterium]